MHGHMNVKKMDVCLL